MTRFLATAAICLSLFVSLPVYSQSDSDDQCFPWQEYRDGRCVPKPSSAPAAPAIPTPPAPTIPPSPPLAPVVAAPDAAPAPPLRIVCDGGTVSGGQCACPAGFKLTPADGAAFGTCVRTDADNCLGGELTVAGVCHCTGQVTMSGEVYGLEYVNGKCLPKRCPIDAVSKGSRCVAVSDTDKAGPDESRPTSPSASSTEEPERPHCGHGMIRTRSGCVAARRHHLIPNGISSLYRNYQQRFPGYPSPTPQ
jgi:hypothetical protein